MLPDQQPQTCDIDGHRLRFYRAGQGPSLLLIHGITTYSFIWRQLITPLSRQWDVVAVDLLGCGGSDMPLDTSYSIKAHAERLTRLLGRLGIERLHLVGHDLGGGIAQIMAVRNPELVASLSLVNSVAYDFWPVQPIIALRTPVIRRLMMASLDLGVLRLIIRHGLYHKERLTEELFSLFAAPFSTTAGRKAFQHFARCLDNTDLTELAPDLRRLPMPVLLIRGDADPYLSSEIVARLHQEIPGSQLARIDTAAHYLQEDEPAWLLEVLRRFLVDLPPNG